MVLMLRFSCLILLVVTVHSEGHHRFVCDDNITISSRMVCDGLRDCADGTDEASSICQRLICQRGFPKCQSDACRHCRSTRAITQNRGCRITHVPNNGFVALASDSAMRLSAGEMVQNYVGIQYSCMENHYIIGDRTTNMCLGNEWVNTNVPDCQLRCNMREASSITFTTNCYRIVNNRRLGIRCGPNDLVEPGVTMLITCKSGYQSATAIEQQAFCGGRGQWNRRINPCAQICGEEGAEGSALIVSGQTTNNTKVPWHVGIYRESSTAVSDALDYICGGTILNPRLVVSAIHCFWDVLSEKKNPASQYRVVAGKYYRRLNDPREKHTFQILHVKEIHHPSGYSDYDGLYSNDVAVLILEAFIEFKPHVVPACINYHYRYEEKVIAAGKIGRVAGWGLTTSNGQLSNELKTIELPVVDRDVCRASLNQPTRNFLTSDKYCVGLLNMNAAVCRGDSGGGLVFPSIEGSKTVYYLRGLVSTGPNHHDSCDSNSYAFFINTAHFSDFIELHDTATKPEYVDAEDAWHGCQVNGIPDNGYVVEIGNVVADRPLTVGEQVKDGGVIRYYCVNESLLIGNERDTCERGRWQQMVPICRVPVSPPAEVPLVSRMGDDEQCKLREERDYNYQDLMKISQFSSIKPDGYLVKLTFFVIAARDAHIVFSPTAKPNWATENVYEILIGGWVNSRTLIRRKRQDLDLTTETTLNVLRGNVPQRVEIHIKTNGEIKVFIDNNREEPLAMATDPNPLPIKYFGFASYDNALNKYYYDCPDDNWRPPEVHHSVSRCSYAEVWENKYENFYAIADIDGIRPDGYLINMPMSIKAERDAHILLSPNNRDDRSDAVYEILIGGYGNSRVIVRRKQGADELVNNQVANVLATDRYVPFLVLITTTGHIQIFTRKDSQAFILIAEVHDPHPVRIEYISFGSYNANRVQVHFNCSMAARNWG